MSGESLSYFFPVFTKRHHGREQQIGSGIEQYFVGQRACVDRNGEDAGGNSGLYTQGGVFHHKAFPRLYTGFFQPHEIRFRVGLAVFYIKAGHHQFSPENVWEIMVQPVDKADLSGTGDDHRSETAGFYLFQ